VCVCVCLCMCGVLSMFGCACVRVYPPISNSDEQGAKSLKPIDGWVGEKPTN
jgi:hypothetical protein